MFEFEDPTKFDQADRSVLLRTREDIDKVEGWNRIANGFRLNMKLMNDLELPTEPGEYIFNPSDWIDGNFNGDGHAITIEMADMGGNAALFPEMAGNVENLIIHGSIQTNGSRAGSIAGNARMALVRNVYSDVNITSSVVGDNTSGGLFGWMGEKEKHVENCIYAGDFTLPGSEAGARCARVGGVAGWTATKTYVTNVALLGHIYGAGDQTLDNDTENSQNIARNPGNVVTENVYVVNPIQGNSVSDHDKYIHYENEEGIANGELAFFLNGKKSGLDGFYQMIGTDPIPMPIKKDGALVYANAPKYRCDGTPLGETTYSNTYTGEPVIPDHKFVDGFCTVCHQQDPDFPFLDVFPNADHDVNTGYTTHNGGDGSNLAFESSVVEHWNSSWFESYQTIKNLEPGIYRLRVQGLSRVAQWGNAEHNAYETGELSEEYAPMYHSSQYFAEVNGKKIANRFMDITEGRQKERVGETENYSEETDAWVPNSRTACMKYFARGLYWNEPIYFAIESAEDSVNVGVENSLYLYGNWTVWDSWRLDKLTDGDIALIRDQQIAAIQEELEDFEPQVSLMEAYNKAKTDIQSATTLEQIMEASDVLARTPNLIRRSHLAYEAFQSAIEAIAEERSGRSLYGPAAELLDQYLTNNDAEDEDFPHGTSLYILNERLLSEEELTDEIAFARTLLENAIMTSISEGSDVSNIIKNAAFAEDGNFKDWETEITFQGASSNFSSNTGFTDIYPVAGTWNTAFNVLMKNAEIG